MLSEEPIGEPTLETLRHQIVEGDWSGDIKFGNEKVLNGKQAATALQRQGSDPGFFRVDSKGNDAD